MGLRSHPALSEFIVARRLPPALHFSTSQLTSDLARSHSCVVKEKDMKIKLYNLRLGGIIVDS